MMEREGSKHLFAEERKAKILEMLRKNSKLLVPELCEYFNVSPATIRNDLSELKNAGLLRRTHGGAISISKTRFELDTSQKEIKNLPEKKAIAALASDLVDDGDTIILDAGTTAFELAKCLSGKKNLTIVLNDIMIASYLEENTSADIFLTGGNVRRSLHCTVGPLAIKALRELIVDKAFMGTNGISLSRGITTPDINQAEVKKAMIDISTEVIVICESNKVGFNGFAQVAPLSRINRLVTDSKIGKKEVAEFESFGIIVNIADV
jgi:DeoR family fructose operon transcriptional repressor